MNMTKRIWLAVCAAIVLAIGMCSCASVDEGADPVVVHAERTANYALDTFDAFLKFEYENRALINDPAVKGGWNSKEWPSVDRGSPGGDARV
jgi:hypothetical protein